MVDGYRRNDMKKVLITFLLLFSINGYCEILNLECTSNSNHKISYTINIVTKKIYNPYSKNTFNLEITENEFRWVEYYSDGSQYEYSINRFTGLNIGKRVSGIGGSPVPYKCENIKSRKF